MVILFHWVNRLPPRENCKQFGKSTGRNESTAELLVKVWEGIRKFLEVPKESTGSFFRHMRVGMSCGYSCQSSQKVFIMKVAFFFVSTKVGFQISYRGHV